MGFGVCESEVVNNEREFPTMAIFTTNHDAKPFYNQNAAEKRAVKLATQLGQDVDVLRDGVRVAYADAQGNLFDTIAEAIIIDDKGLMVVGPKGGAIKSNNRVSFKPIGIDDGEREYTIWEHVCGGIGTEFNSLQELKLFCHQHDLCYELVPCLPVPAEG